MGKTMEQSQYIRRAEVSTTVPVAAAEELSKALAQENMAGVIFFCSADYDPDALAEALESHFDCPVVGCTAAGEIGSTYQTGGVVGMSFSSEMFRVHPVLIESLSTFDATRARDLATNLEEGLEFSSCLDPSEMFGVLLIDGLSGMEEPVVANLFPAIQRVPLIGGSAGDSMNFAETRVYSDGKFRTGVALLLLVETKLEFQTFKLQHFEPSDIDMVITSADPETRTVYEIDGGPAAEEYAELLGLELDALVPQVFSKYPVMLQIGEEWYVRSIQKVNEDGSLTFFCAIEEGLPLTVAKGVGFVETLSAKVEELKSEFKRIDCTLGFDCTLRRLEMLESGHQKPVENLLKELNFIGFSTFGEQFNAIHINHTLSGVILGAK
ncbi:MAG: FIST C-terminal domain-containing protein [Kofleriaceae bacterium]|nr:FIST C-terminal domain-containing protein [Kofleriaceae bacterium]